MKRKEKTQHDESILNVPAPPADEPIEIAFEVEEPLEDVKPAKKTAASKDPDSDSSLTWYLDRINRIPLLSREDEDKYARLALEGDEKERRF